MRESTLVGGEFRIVSSKDQDELNALAMWIPGRFSSVACRLREMVLPSGNDGTARFNRSTRRDLVDTSSNSPFLSDT